jgi:transcriptional regulator with XRE-family HTH domain/KaiC/GvpD/RAD55 family RecA-like ATPase
MSEKNRMSSGVSHLDRILGGLFIGDNVVWYDDSGSLAYVFCLNFIQASLAFQKPVLYVCFDRPPRNLLEKLGPIAESPDFIILDGFTCGKGDCASTFMRYYEEPHEERLCQVMLLEKPRDMGSVRNELYKIHGTLKGDVRLIFDSMTGMQKIWGGEDDIVKFYAHSCPRLYELNTIAYWIMERMAHSSRLRAQISQISQVAINLSISRGTTTLTIVKAENREDVAIDRPYRYSTKDLTVLFEEEEQGPGQLNLGLRIKKLRLKRGLSQTKLAKLVGVNPSSISQVESNLVYPSLPALLKIAEVLAVNISSLFQQMPYQKKRIIFPVADAFDMNFRNIQNGAIQGKLLTPPDFEGKMEPYLLEIEPKQELPTHFFVHKGEEMGYLISGRLKMALNGVTYTIRAGDIIYLSSDMPNSWKNMGPMVARLLWIKSKA